MIKLVNLTPHKVTLLLGGSTEIILPSDGIVTVFNKRERCDKWICGMPVYRRTETCIEGLPGRKKGVYYIVSHTAAEVAWSKGRRDVIAFSGHVWLKGGKLLGCKSFDMYPYKSGSLNPKERKNARLE